MSVLLASKVKEAEIWLPRFLSQIEELEGNISRVVFMYGKSRDKTFSYLDHYRKTSKWNVEIYEDPFLPITERHGSMLARIKKDIQKLLREGDEEYYLNLDCDLVVLPRDLIQRLKIHNKDLIAGMVWTENRTPDTFFDIYVYRKDGCMFHPFNPPGKTKKKPFPVDSVSTCYLAKREVELAGTYVNPHPHIPFCKSLKNRGYQIWVDPQTNVVHIDLEKLGIQHMPLESSPYNTGMYIMDDGVKLGGGQLAAQQFFVSQLNYTSWLANERQGLFVSYRKFLDSRPLITASYKVLNESEFLRYSLKSVYPFVDCIDIVEGSVKHARHASNIDGSSVDDTIKIIKKFPDKQKKIRLFQGKWDSKEEMQAKLLEVCGSKWMLFIDGDEVVENMGTVRTFAAMHQSGGMVYVRPERFYNFWHDFKHIAYSLNPISPWAQFGLPHPFMIYRDIPGLNFGGFHTIPVDGFGNQVNTDTPFYRGKQKVLDGVFVYHFGNAKSRENMFNKLLFEVNRGSGLKALVERGYNPKEKVEEDMWFSGVLPEDMVIEDWNGKLPKILKRHPRIKEVLVEVTESKPQYKFRRLEK